MIERKKLLLSILAGIIAGLAIATSMAFLKVSLHGKFLPGTHISNIDLSYKTPEESIEILNTAKEKYFEEIIKINLGDESIARYPQELGINIFPEKTVQTVEEIDASEIFLFNLLLPPQKTSNTDLVVYIDQEKLLSELEYSFNLKELRAKSASFYFDENNKLSIKEEKKGMTLDKKAVVEELKNSAKELKNKEISLNLFEESPKISKKDLENKEEEIKEALRHKFSLLDPIYSDDWHLSLIEHLDWVEFTEKQKIKLPYLNKEIIVQSEENEIQDLEMESYIAIEIDKDKLNEFIDSEVSKWLDMPPENVNIYTDENEEIQIEGKGSNGLKIQRTYLKQGIELAVAEKIKEIPIPVLEIPPEITVSSDLQELGIKERIAVGHTSYYGSPGNRIHNIKVGSSQFNGLLVEPGEIFSFNSSLGPVDGAHGYRKELVIKHDGTKPEYGGGICQVSTTMYRTALFAGVPIVERNEHSYAVSYYSQVLGHGLDATIYLGGANLKFENDTGHHILIQTYTKNDYELYIVFYGTSDGRSVEMEGPYLSNYHYPGPTQYIKTTDLPPGATKQVERSHTGFNVLWYRYITDKNGEKLVEEILTRYKAIPAKILVGTDG